MFGFLGSSEVNDDAVKLKMLCDNVAKKYLSLDEKKLCSALEHDFDKEHRDVKNWSSRYNVTYPEMPLFMFMLRSAQTVEIGDGTRNVMCGHATVFGVEVYFRFMMSIGNDAKYWTCEI